VAPPLPPEQPNSLGFWIAQDDFRKAAVGRHVSAVSRALVHRPCLKTALYKSFNILDNSGLCPELSTCALPGLYQRSKR
jgi:hypothetical protein